MKKWLNINPKSIKYVQAVFVFQINHYKYMYNTIDIHPTFFLLCYLYNYKEKKVRTERSHSDCNFVDESTYTF